MENIKTFEGFLGMNPHNNVVEKIINYVRKNNVVAESGYGRYYFTMITRKYNDNADPFGEEVNVEEKDYIKCEADFAPPVFTYKVYVNDQELDCSNYMANKLYRILKHSKKNVEKMNRNAEIEKFKKKLQ